ncbi:MAG: hypothetical protein ABIZ70_07280 [Gemmatimonadales bacterium]
MHPSDPFPSLSATGAFVAPVGEDHTFASGISWSAVFGGAIVIASMSFILLALGTGLGLSSMTPWSAPRDTTKVIGMATVAWLVIMQMISGGLGGYLAGRIRNRWLGIHTDETYFRDTLHGFLAWGLALCGTIAFLAAASSVMAGGAAASTPDSRQEVSTNAYFVDVMLRPTTPITTPASPEVRGELERILTRTLLMAGFARDDMTAAGRIISQQTGIAQAAAEQRAVDVAGMAAKAAEDAKDAVGHSLLWVFVGLLVGAFSASFAATLGGRTRDQVQRA